MTTYKICFNYVEQGFLFGKNFHVTIPIPFNDKHVIQTELKKKIDSLESSKEKKIIIQKVWLETTNETNLAGILSET